jgi:DNA modification methylase
MIWHCSDNSGLTPDPNRYGRRTYETAMLITLGDRKISKSKALSFSSPRNISRIHRSQKPLPVLSHFFEMFIDDSTRFLDPTCGSATSLIAAQKFSPASTLGLEIDPEMAASARELYLTEVNP